MGDNFQEQPCLYPWVCHLPDGQIDVAREVPADLAKFSLRKRLQIREKAWFGLRCICDCNIAKKSDQVLHKRAKHWGEDHAMAKGKPCAKRWLKAGAETGTTQADSLAAINKILRDRREQVDRYGLSDQDAILHPFFQTKSIETPADIAKWNKICNHVGSCWSADAWNPQAGDASIAHKEEERNRWRSIWSILAGEVTVEVSYSRSGNRDEVVKGIKPISEREAERLAKAWIKGPAKRREQLWKEVSGKVEYVDIGGNVILAGGEQIQSGRQSDSNSDSISRGDTRQTLNDSRQSIGIADSRPSSSGGDVDPRRPSLGGSSMVDVLKERKEFRRNLEEADRHHDPNYRADSNRADANRGRNTNRGGIKPVPIKPPGTSSYHLFDRPGTYCETSASRRSASLPSRGADRDRSEGNRDRDRSEGNRDEYSPYSSTEENRKEYNATISYTSSKAQGAMSKAHPKARGAMSKAKSIISATTLSVSPSTSVEKQDQPTMDSAEKSAEKSFSPGPPPAPIRRVPSKNNGLVVSGAGSSTGGKSTQEDAKQKAGSSSSDVVQPISGTGSAAAQSSSGTSVAPGAAQTKSALSRLNALKGGEKAPHSATSASTASSSSTPAHTTSTIATTSTIPTTNNTPAISRTSPTDKRPATPAPSRTTDKRPATPPPSRTADKRPATPPSPRTPGKQPHQRGRLPPLSDEKMREQKIACDKTRAHILHRIWVLQAAVDDAVSNGEVVDPDAIRWLARQEERLKWMGRCSEILHASKDPAKTIADIRAHPNHQRVPVREFGGLGKYFENEDDALRQKHFEDDVQAFANTLDPQTRKCMEFSRNRLKQRRALEAAEAREEKENPTPRKENENPTPRKENSPAEKLRLATENKAGLLAKIRASKGKGAGTTPTASSISSSTAATTAATARNAPVQTASSRLMKRSRPRDEDFRSSAQPGQDGNKRPRSSPR